MIIFWPDGSKTVFNSTQGRDQLDATVQEVDTYSSCNPQSSCQRLLVLIDGQKDPLWTKMPSWQEKTLPKAGDKVRVVDFGEQFKSTDLFSLRYAVVDYNRTANLIILFVLFSLLAIALARKKGVLALIGLAASLAVVVWFLLPAILAAKPLILVSLATAFLVMFLTLFLTHGINLKTLSALIGTSISLLIVSLLAVVFVSSTKLVGFSIEGSDTLIFNETLPLQGLIIAGIIIATLGVLDDVTVSQAATVFALKKANPNLTTKEVFKLAIDVGRDHVSSAINTLIFAYVGASLPLLLILSSGGISLGAALTTDIIAQEIVAMLVGSIGIILAVPLTTFVAATVKDDLKEEDVSHC